MRQPRTALGLLGLLAALGAGPACGPDVDPYVDLSLSLDPRTVPPNLAYVNVYVLLAVLPDNTPLDCEMFVGPGKTHTIYDFLTPEYRNVLVASASSSIDPSAASVLIPRLPEGLLVFVVDALDGNQSHLAWGCGKGQIERGKKVLIPIFLEPG
jgi:hypothetical protein